MITKDQILSWLSLAAAAIDEERDRLSELDREIGDGDHGNNMSRGFRKLTSVVAEHADADLSEIFKSAGMALISTVGGASGPLYGSFFLKAQAEAIGKEALDAEGLGRVLRAGVEAVIARGKAKPDDKTMVDALLPAVEQYERAVGSGKDEIAALEAAVEAAERGMRATIPLQARKGRASYLGERSKGHQDPGATSSYIILRSLLAASAAPKS